jgi:hypothetical protein
LPLVPTLNRSLILVTPKSSIFTLHIKHSKKFLNVFKRHLTSSNIHYFLKEGYYAYYYKWEGPLHVRSLPLLRNMTKDLPILHLTSMYVEIHDNHIRVKII